MDEEGRGSEDVRGGDKVISEDNVLELADHCTTRTGTGNTWSFTA